MVANFTQGDTSTPSTPVKKTQWPWVALFWLWYFGGINVLLLRDIPILGFFGTGFALFCLPVPKWLGRPHSILLRLLWGFVVLVIMLSLILFVIPPVTISPETTYLTEPQSKDFYGIDYPAAVLQRLAPNIPAEENGVRLLLEKMGRSLLPNKVQPDDWQQLCTYLNFPSDMEPSVAFMDWREYVETLEPAESEVVSPSCDEFVVPSSEEAQAIIHRWLEPNETAIDLFVAAIQKPVLYVPVLSRKLTSDFSEKRVFFECF